MPPKPSNVNILIDESDPQSSRKRKCPSSRLQTHPSPPTSTAYSSAYEDSMKMFQAATNSITKRNPTHGASKSTTPTANPGPTSASMFRVTPLPQSSTKRVSTMQGTTWKLDPNSNTFVAVVPMNRGTKVQRPTPRANISRPCYHQNAPSSEPSHLPDPGGPSMFSGDIEEELAAGGGNVSSLTSPKAVEEPFVVQYPLYARDLDWISVEQKLSRHVHRWAAAVQHWNRDVIPGLIHLYMEHMCESQPPPEPIQPVTNSSFSNSLIHAQANQSPPPFLVTTSASSHVGATVPLVNSRVVQLRRMPTYLTNSGASTPLDNFPTSMSPPIQVLRDSSASSSSTPNSGPDMMSTHLNGPSQASFSLPSAQVHLSAADFDALQMSFATWAGNGAGLL
ncbi:hypothetical protein BS47DRAFT_1364465 [Hydnum rufescens UP504]|uniref:Uncharacterized protein n=1 Tax=Hydnum rufescens UP504 TaxID=1448309 RepID=A0A9P6ARY1_9AGAM|nr:hypothetical protein BS47DRAFT_1364465 [Hydnum rufescens UP504]